MNKSAKGPNLTWIFIGIAVSVVVITLAFSSYTTFLQDNSVEVSNKITAIQSNISSNQDTIDSIQKTATDPKNVRGVFKDITGGALNVFVTGLASIGAFFQMGKLASSILATTKSSIPGFNALFGLLTLISVFYISMAIIKARRGTTDTS